MALSAANTSDKVAHSTKRLLLKKRWAKHTQFCGYDLVPTYKPNVVEYCASSS